MRHSQPKEAVFMGKVTAAVTHEMKNVLAIIKESSGLMEDLLSMMKDIPQAHQDKFSRMLSNISQQVARGTDLATKLNRFAHSSDNVVAGVDLNDVADLVASLCHRLARSKSITLRVSRKLTPVALVTNPVQIQMLLFECISFLLEFLDAGSIIDIEPSHRVDGSAWVKFLCDGQHALDAVEVERLTASPAWMRLQEDVHALNAVLEPLAPPALFAVIFNRGGHEQDSSQK